MALARWARGVESEAESKNVESGVKSKRAESSFLDSGRLGVLAGDLDSGAVDSGVRSHILPIVLFGGSFDPPHLGHVKIIKALCEYPNIARVIIIPAFCNPFKSAPIAPIAQRIEWLERACDGLAKAQVSDIEQRGAKMMYAIEWIEHFRAEFGAKADEKIILALGVDALMSLHKWKDADKIAKLACVLPITRESSFLDSGAREVDFKKVDLEKADSKKADSAKLESKNLDSSSIITSAQKKDFICLKPLNIDAPISSSELRAAIKAYKADKTRAESKSPESAKLESSADSIDKWLIPNIAAEILKIY